jgi:hypothetical protein
MGSSFEDLVATSLTVKRDFQSDKWFELQSFLNFRISTLNADDVSSFIFWKWRYMRACEENRWRDGVWTQLRLGVNAIKVG